MLYFGDPHVARLHYDFYGRYIMRKKTSASEK